MTLSPAAGIQCHTPEFTSAPPPLQQLEGRLVTPGRNITDPCRMAPDSLVLEVTCRQARRHLPRSADSAPSTKEALGPNNMHKKEDRLNKENLLGLMPDSDTLPCSKLYHFLQLVPVTLHAGISIQPSLF